MSGLLWLPGLIRLVEPWHLGALHPYEKVLTLVLAFGPLLLLVLTIWVSRRRNARESDHPAPE